jgi:hypothetical protein
LVGVAVSDCVYLLAGFFVHDAVLEEDVGIVEEALDAFLP